MTPLQKKAGVSVEQHALHPRLGQVASASEVACLPPERVRAILEERARAFARVLAPTPAAGAMLEVVSFSVSRERYAIEANYVREIFHVPEITPVPGTPDFLAGVANLRGQILAVVDLRRFFGINVQADVPLARVIVLGQERTEFGVLADAVHEVASLRIDQVKDPPGSVAGIARAYLRGVTADALILLDGAVLLKDRRFYIDLGDNARPDRTKEPS